MSAGASFEAAYARSTTVFCGAAGNDAFDGDAHAARRRRPAYRIGRRRASSIRDRRSVRRSQEIARLAKADVGLEIAFAESTNWDHHVNEGSVTGQIADAARRISSRGLAALAADLGDRMADTVILTMSEFGRAVAENGNGGTDHGHGNAMMLLGGTVSRAAGLRPLAGLTPSQRFEGRDLAVTTDFRDVFSEIVTQHLGASPGDALHASSRGSRRRAPDIVPA